MRRTLRPFLAKRETLHTVIPSIQANTNEKETFENGDLSVRCGLEKENDDVTISKTKIFTFPVRKTS